MNINLCLCAFLERAVVSIKTRELLMGVDETLPARFYPENISLVYTHRQPLLCPCPTPAGRELFWSHRKAIYKWLVLACVSVFDLDILTRHRVYTNLFTSIVNCAIQMDTIWVGFWPWLLHVFWEIFLCPSSLLAFCN